MIKAKYHQRGDEIVSLEVSGHAQYESKGKDLICAGVSCIVFGLMNALDVTGKADISDSGNAINITVKKSDAKVQDYMELVIVQLETIAESYPEYIRLERRSDS